MVLHPIAVGVQVGIREVILYLVIAAKKRLQGLVRKLIFTKLI